MGTRASSASMVRSPESRRSINTSSSEQPRPQTSSSDPHHDPTNTLIITRVPPSLLHTSVTPSLRNFFERFGSIEAWVPLTTFERVVVVYSREQDAEQAKQGMDYTLVEGFQPFDSTKSDTVLRVYRGLPTPVETLRGRRYRDHLPVPETDKNFLISPPGSPPVGWEQIREDPPNMETLAEDLARALESLTVDRADETMADMDDEPASIGLHPSSHTSTGLGSPTSPSRASPRDTLIIPHRRTPSGDLPSVMVSDLTGPDASHQGGLTIAEAFSIQRRHSPGPISNVKATVESMQGSSSFPHNQSHIDRTPRPPL